MKRDIQSIFHCGKFHFRCRIHGKSRKFPRKLICSVCGDNIGESIPFDRGKQLLLRYRRKYARRKQRQFRLQMKGLRYDGRPRVNAIHPTRGKPPHIQKQIRDRAYAARNIALGLTAKGKPRQVIWDRAEIRGLKGSARVNARNRIYHRQRKALKEAAENSIRTAWTAFRASLVIAPRVSVDLGTTFSPGIRL